jgi:hypothetical protein
MRVWENGLPRRGDAEPLARLPLPGHMQVPAGAELHDEAGVVRRLEVGVQCRQERVVERAQDLALHLRAPQLLSEGQRVLVHHLHGVQAPRRPRRAQLAEVDVAEVAAAQATQQAEVLQPDAAGGAADAPDGLPLGLVRLVGLVAARRVPASAAAEGTHRDRAGAANVTDPAPAGSRRSERGPAAVVVRLLFDGGSHNMEALKTEKAIK